MESKVYKSGDIVWVLASKRLGWWPGRVENVDLLRSDLKKDVTEKIIAVVRYLNEDNYQFVEDPAIICAYNSNRKEEYISLGMKKYFEKKRINEASSPFMKFPNDVKQAEVLTGGNPNIVENEKYQPKKPVPAQAKYKDIFVDPRAKEPKTKTPAKIAPSPRKPGRPPKDSSPTNRVNQPRFAGNLDHEVRIRKQENTPSPASSATNGYKCDSCDFQTTRLNLMVIHQKMHLSGSQSPQKSGQKRTISPPKKVANKRAKKNQDSEGDLFDQVKRTLEAKESGASKVSPQPKKTNKASATPKTPRTPRTAKTSPTSSTSKSSSTKPSDSKAQLNPKKKWLKSSLQKEANPEVKIKLMADWEDEDDDGDKLKTVEEKQPEPSKPPINEDSTQMDSDSDQELVPAKPVLLQRRSDDEDDDSNMETETKTSLEKVSETIEERSDSKETDEPFAGITAEIDRLNADLDARREEKPRPEVPSKEETVSREDAQLKKESAQRSDDEIRQELASLLAETSVPVLPDISTIAKPLDDDAEKESDSIGEGAEKVPMGETTQAEVAASDEVVQNGEEAVVAKQVDEIVVQDQVVKVAPEKAKNVATELTEDFTTEPTQGVAAEPTEYVTTEATEDVTTEPTEDVTTEPTEDVTTEPTEDVTTEPTEDVTTEPTEDVTTEPTEDVTTESTEGVTTKPTEDLVTEQVEEVVGQQVQCVQQIAMVGGDVSGVVTNGAEEEATTNGNILMQVEGGETYMVVWEPGSNIQELLACSAEGDDGTPGATQTLLIDPSALQAGSELENLFQMAVAASAAPTPPNEQSNPTQTAIDEKKPVKGSVPKGAKRLTHEALIKKHGNAVGRGLEANTLVWACVNAHLFVPAAVFDSHHDAKRLGATAFDVHRPNNQRKYPRTRVIPAFNHELNIEVLEFCRSRNKAAVNAKLNQSFDHAREFARLRQEGPFKELTAHQYLTCCHRSPVKLFSDRYLNCGPDDELENVPEPLNDSDSLDEADPEESVRNGQIVEKLVNEHAMTDECLEHLARYVKRPSERMKLYETKKWSLLSQLATSGILENAKKLYVKLADFLMENVHQVKELQEGKDHKRCFVLDVLLPEALSFAVQKTFCISEKEAANLVIYGLKKI